MINRSFYAHLCVQQVISVKWRGNKMPLSMAKTGEENCIRRVGGQTETRQFLEKLGFVAGGRVTVVAELSGNVIVSIKDSRIAISRELASKIIV